MQEQNIFASFKVSFSDQIKETSHSFACIHWIHQDCFCTSQKLDGIDHLVMREEDILAILTD